jgi:hypothetical protein
LKREKGAAARRAEAAKEKSGERKKAADGAFANRVKRGKVYADDRLRFSGKRIDGRGATV